VTDAKSEDVAAAFEQRRTTNASNEQCRIFNQRMTLIVLSERRSSREKWFCGLNS
jgi:hypothetical protein